MKKEIKEELNKALGDKEEHEELVKRLLLLVLLNLPKEAKSQHNGDWWVEGWNAYRFEVIKILNN